MAFEFTHKKHLTTPAVAENIPPNSSSRADKTQEEKQRSNYETCKL